MDANNPIPEPRRDLVAELRAVSAFEYRRISTDTVSGLRQAERLHMAGWRTVRTGLFYIDFERRKPTKGRD